ncbi:MAG: hypothetical protein ACREQI_00875 [Candidatus Binataceae bacterium]
MAQAASDIRPLKERFEFVTEGGLDERKRLSLAKALGKVEARINGSAADLHFRVYVNEAGQILLDPAVSIPAREMWLYRTPGALASFRRSVKQAERGEFAPNKSFARYAGKRRR